AGQAPDVGRRAPALVRGGQAPAVHLAPAAARAERGRDQAPDRPPGVRQGGGRPGIEGRVSVEIQVREHGRHVVVLTIDNPPRLNAMSRQMMADLARLWDDLDRGSCRCVVLTGAGTRAFCAGADMSGDLSASAETAKVVSHALLKHHVFSKPIVAAVNGDCVGGGVELLLSTDVRAAAPHAPFGLPEVRWSIYPFGGATVKLTQQIGYVHAMDLLLTGRLVDAAEAARLGLVNRVVPADALMAWALETAETIAANSPSAVQAAQRHTRAPIADPALAPGALEEGLGEPGRGRAECPGGVRAVREGPKAPPRRPGAASG